jgi:ribokinase
MKALTIGGAMIDTIAVIDNDLVERMAMRNADQAFLLLEEGRKIEARDVSTHCGGGAVNAAVAMARLGHDVSALVKLGQDARAETILAHLASEQVSTRFAVRDARAPTGASVLVSAHDRNAAVFTFRGANTLLEPHDLKRDAFAVDLVYVSGLSNKSADCFPVIIDMAKAQGAMVATNPGIRQLSARIGAFQETLAKIDILTINRVEAGALVPWLNARFGDGKGPALVANAGEELPEIIKHGLSGGGFEMTVPAFFAAMRSLGPRYVVITDGRNGAMIGGPNGILHCPVIEVEVAGTAGAGDAFASTFASSIAQGMSVEDAAMSGAINSSSVIGHTDTQSGLLRRDALMARLESVRGTLALRHWGI